MSWKAHKAIEFGRELIGQSREDLAAELTRETGDEWSYQMVAKLENGRKVFTVDLLQTIAKIQELPFEWYLVDPRSRLGRVGVNPGSLNSTTDSGRYGGVNLQTDHAGRLYRMIAADTGQTLYLTEAGSWVDETWVREEVEAHADLRRLLAESNPTIEAA